MDRGRRWWLPGTAAVLAAVIIPLATFMPRPQPPRDDPRAALPERGSHTSHAALLQGPFPDGPSVTRACLECHPDAAGQVMHTAHWKWEGDPVLIPGHDEPRAIGKKNLINNFCISVQSNWAGCTACHAGYGWKDAGFDFTRSENVDCLVCHDRSGAYAKGRAGLPAPGVDLLAAARSVGRPTRENCGSCHFRGGGGDAVKHGDLDASLTYPRERVDVHMGKHGMICTDCHRTQDHAIRGRSISVSVDDRNQVACTDCHAERPHEDARLNDHVSAVACETCHIPEAAIREATKIHWDWSAAGQDREDDPHHYLKIKGAFVYQRELVPETYWWNGTADRYLLGDTMDPATVTPINRPRGDIRDPGARIWPFKVHRGTQIYDRVNRTFLVPKTFGEGGYWTDFDWDEAARLGSAVTGVPYSGQYGFAPTEMYWPLSHMVAPAEDALQCADCHGKGTRLDWKALGYPGDPVHWGGRRLDGLAVSAEGGAR